ncbi:unnamed protein product [Cyprideis torosa]|uniref:Uncharacterized protein n=1 Tax=Cyprideis torosa TaxID=163714 RepID=A0A7R8WAU1_9CRUS|nr:unnamed protein product [Cyprideis torosa]CAG0888759.1 unnamed protein product [Cyprideis torosa]
MAANKTSPAIISFLLNHGAQVDTEDKLKRTPLLFAIGRNSSSSHGIKPILQKEEQLQEQERLLCVKILLEAGADVRHCDRDGNDALHYATSRCYRSIAQHLLTADPSLCLVKNSQGKTAITLQQAVEWGHPAIVSILLQHGMDVNEEDERKRTPLMLAIGQVSSPTQEEDRLQCVKILLEAGANVLHCDEYGNNALHYATSHRYRSIAQHLLTVNPFLCLVKNSNERTALHMAASKSQPDIISILLQHGAKVDEEETFRATPLLLAIGLNSSPSEEKDRLQCVKILLQAGANVRHRNWFGENAFHYASRKNFLHIAEHLLTVDPFLCLVKDSVERTALHIAAYKAQPDIISLLLQHGAQVDEEDEWERTPLLLAIRYFFSSSEEERGRQCVKILLEAGADVRHCDPDGNDALHYASRNGLLHIAEHLLTVDPCLCLVKNSAERKALHIAADEAQPDIISLLLQHGAQVEQEDNEKRTPLLLAIGRNSCPSKEERRLHCVKILLEAGANVRHCDRTGYNALHYAIRNSYQSIVQELIMTDLSLLDAKNNIGKTPFDLADDNVKVQIEKLKALLKQDNPVLDAVTGGPHCPVSDQSCGSKKYNDKTKKAPGLSRPAAAAKSWTTDMVVPGNCSSTKTEAFDSSTNPQWQSTSFCDNVTRKRKTSWQSWFRAPSSFSPVQQSLHPQRYVQHKRQRLLLKRRKKADSQENWNMDVSFTSFNYQLANPHSNLSLRWASSLAIFTSSHPSTHMMKLHLPKVPEVFRPLRCSSPCSLWLERHYEPLQHPDGRSSPQEMREGVLQKCLATVLMTYTMLAANSCTERRNTRWNFAASMDVRSLLETREGTLQKCLAAFLPTPSNHPKGKGYCYDCMRYFKPHIKSDFLRTLDVSEEDILDGDSWETIEIPELFIQITQSTFDRKLKGPCERPGGSSELPPLWRATRDPSESMPAAQIHPNQCLLRRYIRINASCADTFEPMPPAQIHPSQCLLRRYIRINASCADTFEPMPPAQIHPNQCLLRRYIRINASCADTFDGYGGRVYVGSVTEDASYIRVNASCADTSESMPPVQIHPNQCLLRR